MGIGTTGWRDTPRDAQPVRSSAYSGSVGFQAGCVLIGPEPDRFRTVSRQVRGLALGAAELLGSVSVLDRALFAPIMAMVGFDEDFDGYRGRYDLSPVTAGDLVVGNTLDWGHRVTLA